jgi:hypothetical protein
MEIDGVKHASSVVAAAPPSSHASAAALAAQSLVTAHDKDDDNDGDSSMSGVSAGPPAVDNGDAEGDEEASDPLSDELLPTSASGKADLARLLAHAEDWRQGLFRRTTGWPRKLRDQFWNSALAVNFNFWWNCKPPPVNGQKRQPLPRIVALCDGICMRGIHLQ